MQTLTLAVGIATIATVIVYAVQAYLMRSAIVHSNRCYIALSGVNIDQIPDANQQTTGVLVTVRWENGGNTPTRNMMNRVNWEMRLDSLPSDFDFPDLQSETGESPAIVVLGPKQNMGGQSFFVSAHHLIALRAKYARLYCWGYASYRDVFRLSTLHKTEFCFELRVDRVQSTEVAMVIADMYYKHNGIDQDCYHKPGEKVPTRALQPITIPADLIQREGPMRIFIPPSQPFNAPREGITI
jgi:hypothetical protein